MQLPRASRADRCIACGSEHVQQCLDLGVQPPANELTATPTATVASFPLGLNNCAKCGHGQLSYFAPPETLFLHYLYRSDTSETLARYFDWFADALLTEPGGPQRVLEIGANDGSLLSKVRFRGADAVGIDPARNIVSETCEDSIIREFFPSSRLGSERFDTIIGLNVLAHNPAPAEMLAAVEALLTDNGRAIFQTSQARMLVNGEFDTIYHEHYSFFTPRSLAACASRVGLRVRDWQLTDIHGTSFVFELCKKDVTGSSTLRPFTNGEFSVQASDRETLGGFLDGDMRPKYDAFARQARTRMVAVSDQLQDATNAGQRTAMIGAAAKALTFSRAAGLEFDYVLDEAKDKIGMFIPYTGNQIMPLESIAHIEQDILHLISAWNFAEELTAKMQELRDGHDGDRVCVYFPDLRTGPLL